MMCKIFVPWFHFLSGVYPWPPTLLGRFSIFLHVPRWPWKSDSNWWSIHPECRIPNVRGRKWSNLRSHSVNPAAECRGKVSDKARRKSHTPRWQWWRGGCPDRPASDPDPYPCRLAWTWSPALYRWAEKYCTEWPPKWHLTWENQKVSHNHRQCQFLSLNFLQKTFFFFEKDFFIQKRFFLKFKKDFF